MSTLILEKKEARASDVRASSKELSVELVDGRSLTVPIAWFPRLLEATKSERDHWRLIGDGEGIHWPELDEDISVEALLAGKGAMESQASFTRWLKARGK